MVYLVYFPNHAGEIFTGMGFGQRKGEKGIATLYNPDIKRIACFLREKLMPDYQKIRDLKSQIFLIDPGIIHFFQQEQKVFYNDEEKVKNQLSPVNYLVLEANTPEDLSALALDLSKQTFPVLGLSLPFDYSQISDELPEVLRRAA